MSDRANTWTIGTEADETLTPRSFVLTILFFLAGVALHLVIYETPAPLLFAALITLPVLLVLALWPVFGSADIEVFLRSFSVGLFAAGIAAFYAVVFFDAEQLASDASSFYELSSQSGTVRSIQDLRTVTEGAGAVVLWSWFYDFAAFFGFARESYIGIIVNVLIVSLASLVCARSAHAIFGNDPYRLKRLVLFVTISGNLWLFAGIHLRDSVIFLAIAVLAHFWIAFLSEFDRRKLLPAVIVTGVMMPALQVLRAEFFYIPIMIAGVALLALNFSRGRGDNRFIMLISIILGVILLIVALVAFGEEIQRMIERGQDDYTVTALGDARSGSLGAALIINQPLYIRLVLGIPYLFYFPVPVWNGFGTTSALQLFKSINALSFYFISASAFMGIYLIAVNRQLRSPAFVFIALAPTVLTVAVVMTSLETRHLGSFISFFFLLGLLPDTRDPEQAAVVRVILLVILLGAGLVHAAWLALRYV